MVVGTDELPVIMADEAVFRFQDEVLSGTVEYIREAAPDAVESTVLVGVVSDKTDSFSVVVVLGDFTAEDTAPGVYLISVDNFLALVVVK